MYALLSILPPSQHTECTYAVLTTYMLLKSSHAFDVKYSDLACVKPCFIGGNILMQTMQANVFRRGKYFQSFRLLTVFSVNYVVVYSRSGNR